MNKKLIITISALAAAIMLIAVGIFALSSAKPETVADPRPTGTVTPLPVATPQETAPAATPGTEAWAEYDEKYTNFVAFNATDSHLINFAGISKDCDAEVSPAEGAYLDGYSIHYSDTAKTTPVDISCSWNIPSESYDDFQENLEDAQIDGDGNTVTP